MNDVVISQNKWLSTIYFGLQVLLTVLFLLNNFSKGRVLLTVGFILIASMAIELIGVESGFPFGEYSYTESLPLLVFGRVPLIIGLCWVIVVTNSVILIYSFLAEYVNGFVISLISASIILLFDLFLEPYATIVNKLWIWNGGKIPWQNYASWWVIGFLFSLAVFYLIKLDTDKVKERYVPITIIGLNLVQFLTVNVIYAINFINK